MRISDWSSDVCSSDLLWLAPNVRHRVRMLGKVQLRSVFVNPEYSHGLPSRSCLLPATPLFREVIAAVAGSAGHPTVSQIGRAACRESVCQDGYISVVAVTLKQKYPHQNTRTMQ